VSSRIRFSPGPVQARGALPNPCRSLANSFRRLVPALQRAAVQLGASATQPSTTAEEVNTMAKKDDGHKEIKKGKESER
jgi:hypothetical protein